ncbi:MAG: hypothetical protein WEB33_13475 [Bacteroidota bacterium]
MIARRFLFFVLLASCSSSVLVAQIVPIVSSVKTGEAQNGQPLVVAVELSQNVGVSQVMFVYRQFGQSEFKELEMALSGRSASVSVPANAVRSPYVEYYVRVSLVGGKKETYPVQNPEANPLKIAVREPDPKDQEVQIISPEPGSVVAVEELGVVISLFYAPPQVDPKATRIFLDGIDVSKDAVLSEDLLIYSPQNFNLEIPRGAHILTVELVDTTGKLYHRVRTSFTATTVEELASEETRFRGRVDGQLELRDEALAASHRSYIRGDLRTNATYSIFQFGGMMHLDNQDKPTVQPQNRFSIFAQTDWLRLEYGDAYPRFPSLMVSGKRVRGFTASLATGVLNLDVSIGQTTRGVEGIVDSTVAVDTSNFVPPKNSKLLRDTTYAFFTGGTYKRNFLAVRTSFGSNEGTQWGLGFVKAKDDVGSIAYGVLPQENLVVGSDFRVAIDDENFKWETQASLSLTNTDITDGSFSQADYDQLKQSDPETGDNLEKVGKIAEKIITVNEFLFPTNPVGKGLPSLALESALTLNYFNNYLTGAFFRRGASYTSFGNDFLQTDVQGFMIADRIRMFNNRVYLSLSYEAKNDNTADTKEGTTKFGNFNSSVTVNPVNFPAFTIGYGFNNRIADYNILSGPDTSNVVQVSKFADEVTNRFYLGTNYDFVALGNRQNVGLTVSIANKEDRTFYKANQSNLFLQLNWTQDYRIPLQTIVGFSISNNKNDLQLFTPAGADSVLTTNEFNYTSLSFGARYRMFEDKLRLAADIVPIFGAISRVNFQAGAQYAMSINHSLELFFGYIQNASQADDIISSLIYRFNF